jgi:HPt (histidine-containing phosphotransfer) domain-containing protein
MIPGGHSRQDRGGGPELDPAALRALSDLIGDDPEALDELLEEFIVSAPDRLAELRCGVETGNRELTARAAHTLKANGGTFGAVELAGRCRELEVAARSTAAPLDLGQVAAIEDEWRRVRGNLRALSSGTGA